ncbi:MAG: efflux RND transporter periplasmic adaptor subunit [Planctomycetota bacterium]|jgi:multidrug efflux pump subunit AcrA (membrane-fusion protein)
MSTEVLPEKSRHQQPPFKQQRSNHRGSSLGRHWKRGLLAIAVVTVIASAATLVPGIGSSRNIGPRLTHTVTSSDLIVTVTEKGTLESSENTEIKCKVRTAAVPIIWVIENGTEVKAGDELLRLETLDYDDRLNEMSKYYHSTQSGAERSRADVARAELAIPEYLEGRYRTQLMRLQKDLAIAESNLRTAQNLLAYAEMMAERGYVSGLEIEDRTFAVTQAELNVGVKKTEIDVLKNFTKAIELETLNGNLKASKARHEADKEQIKFLEVQVDFAKNDIKHCVVKAEKEGLVIYPTGRPWERVPEIEEGASVYMGQTMLLMPDLTRMQVKIGIHESFIDRMKPGLAARVTLPDRILAGEVSTVASVTEPAGEWNGYVVKYETIVKLPSVSGLKPGMSAEVEVILARHENVLTIPVAAVVETTHGDFCWIKTSAGVKRRSLQLGDTNDVFTIVEAGLQEGDEVVLHPFAFKEAQALAIKPRDEEKPLGQESTKPSGSPGAGKKSKAPDKSNKQKSKPQGLKPKQVDSKSKKI